MKSYIRRAALAVCTTLLLAAGAASAGEMPQVTGTYWMNSSVQEKKAFLLGIGTMAATELEVQKGNPQDQRVSAIPTLIDGLRDYNITTTISAVDNYYKSHADDLSRPIIDVLWFELALPNMQNSQK